jgi:hypothetical protein
MVAGPSGWADEKLALTELCGPTGISCFRRVPSRSPLNRPSADLDRLKPTRRILKKRDIA